MIDNFARYKDYKKIKNYKIDRRAATLIVIGIALEVIIRLFPIFT